MQKPPDKCGNFTIESLTTRSRTRNTNHLKRIGKHNNIHCKGLILQHYTIEIAFSIAFFKARPRREKNNTTTTKTKRATEFYKIGKIVENLWYVYGTYFTIYSTVVFFCNSKCSILLQLSYYAFFPKGTLKL